MRFLHWHSSSSPASIQKAFFATHRFWTKKPKLLGLLLHRWFWVNPHVVSVAPGCWPTSKVKATLTPSIPKKWTLTHGFSVKKRKKDHLLSQIVGGGWRSTFFLRGTLVMQNLRPPNLADSAIWCSLDLCVDSWRVIKRNDSKGMMSLSFLVYSNAIWQN